MVRHQLYVTMLMHKLKYLNAKTITENKKSQNRRICNIKLLKKKKITNMNKLKC